MNYLLYIDHILSPKNNLEKEVFEYLSQGDRLSLSIDGMSRLQKAMLYHVSNLNLKHKRCMPVVLSFRPKENGDIEIFIGDGIMSPFRATFLKVADI